jgi:uncharacterized protein YjiS (DUF1127 family)
MTHFTFTTNARTAETSWTGRLTARLQAGFQRFLLRRRLKMTVYTLQALDDRTLSDIGIDRSEIESLANSKAAGRRQRYVEIGGVIGRG